MAITNTSGTVFEKIALDIVGPLPKTKDDKEYILTIQDQLSKFSLAVPLPNALITSISDAFIKQSICIFGGPKVKISSTTSHPMLYVGYVDNEGRCNGATYSDLYED